MAPSHLKHALVLQVPVPGFALQTGLRRTDPEQACPPAMALVLCTGTLAASWDDPAWSLLAWLLS